LSFQCIGLSGLRGEQIGRRSRRPLNGKKISEKCPFCKAISALNQINTQFASFKI
jgi:hypothetical protein